MAAPTEDLSRQQDADNGRNRAGRWLHNQLRDLIEKCCQVIQAGRIKWF